MRKDPDALRKTVHLFDGSMPTVHLDSALVKPSRWMYPHEASFVSPTFVAFQAAIEGSGGNVQPILVRDAGDGLNEIVFTLMLA